MFQPTNESSELSDLSSNMSAMSVKEDPPQTAKLNWKVPSAKSLLRCVPVGESVEKMFDMLGITWLVKFYPRGLPRQQPSTAIASVVSDNDGYSSIAITAMCAIGSVGPTTTFSDFDKMIGDALGKFGMTFEMDGWNCILITEENKPILAAVGCRECFYQFVPLAELNNCQDSNDNFSITLSMKSIQPKL